MRFKLTDEQWTSIASKILELRGSPLDWVRESIEKDASQIFYAKDRSSQEEKALRRFSDAASKFCQAAQELARCQRDNAHLNELLEDAILEEAAATERLAQRVDQRATAAAWVLDQGFGVDHHTSRGRPADVTLEAWSATVLQLARHERWALYDRRGQTASLLVDLMVEIAGYLRIAGLDHGRDIRRALTRAISKALQDFAILGVDRDINRLARLPRHQFDGVRA